MLITFKSRTHADIVMFGDVALKLIKMMGCKEGSQGVIEPEDIPQALKSLRQGVAAEDVAVEEDETEEDEDEEAEQVSAHNRALPLIDMLNNAIKDDVPVTWEEGGRSY